MRMNNNGGSTSLDQEIADELARFYADTLGFVLWAYPWGRPGPLKDFKGPNRDQERILIDLGDAVRKRNFDGRHAVEPIQMAMSSGHGTGKTAVTSFIADWAMSTRPGLHGTVTATTAAQLDTKTWAAIERWTKLLVNAHWFNITSERLWYKGQ